MRTTAMALRYRRGQAVALGLLAALVTGTVAFIPIFVRSVEQGLTLEATTMHPVSVNGLTISSASQLPSGSRAASPAALTALLPASARSAFGPETSIHSGRTQSLDAPGRGLTGQLWTGTGECRHVRLVQGRCPTGVAEIAVSTADSRRFGLVPGRQVVSANDLDSPVPSLTLRVVGVYQVRPGPYWFNESPTGKSGLLDVEATKPSVQHDDWLTSPQTFTFSSGYLANDTSQVRMPVLPGLSVDRFVALGPALRTLDDRVILRENLGGLSVGTGLRELVRSVVVQRSQARVTVPILMLQLVALVLFVLCLVLSTAIDQRRPEVAAALLRGHGRRGARRLLLAELMPATLAGVPLGAVAAVVLASVARHVIIAPTPPAELPSTYWLALLAVVVLLMAVTYGAVLVLTRHPVERMLRRVGARAGFRLGAPAAMVLAGSGALVVAFAAGALRGPLALTGPALLALLVGLVASMAITPLASAVGGRLLRRGRWRWGLSILDAARSAATRRTVALLTVAAALLVFAADAFVVGAHNRDLAAVQAVGADRVLTIQPRVSADPTRIVASLRQAIRTADPGGHLAAPVVRVQPPSPTAPVTMLVDPPRFAAVARPQQPLPLGKLPLPASPRLHVAGTHLSLQVAPSLDGVDAETGQVQLEIGLQYPTGSPVTVRLGPRALLVPAHVHTTVMCQNGCDITGVGLSSPFAGTYAGTLRLSGLTVDGRAVGWGRSTDWAPTRSGPDTGSVTAGAHGSIVVHLDKHSDAGDLLVSRTSSPPSLPAIGTGQLRLPGAPGPSDLVETSGIDGVNSSYRIVDHEQRLPGAPPTSLLTDLDAQQVRQLDPTAVLQVWLGSESTGLQRRVVAALRREGFSVIDQQSLSGQRLQLARTAAAWSLLLGLGVGGAGVLVALIALVVIGLSQWRLRSYDLASLRMAGLGEQSLARTALTGQLIAVGLGVLVGALCGVGGAQMTIRYVPLFASPPAVSTLDLAPSWLAVLLATLTCAVVLGATGWRIARSVTARAGADRLRESV